MPRPNILYTAFVAQDYFSTPVKKMGTSVKGLSTITTLAGNKMAASLGAVSAAAQQVGIAGAMMGTAIAVPLGLATKAAIDFEAQMSNVSTLLDTTVENMDDMGASVQKLAREIPKPLSDFTEGLYYVRSAGVDAANAMGVLEASGKLAVAGLSTTSEAARAVTSALTNFKNQGLSATQVANSFFLTVREGKTKMEFLNESFGATALAAAGVGVKLQELNAATAALTNAGMEASNAQISIANTLISMQKPTEALRSVFAALKVETGEQLIAMLGYGGALDAVAQKSRELKVDQSLLFNRTAYKAFLGLTGVVRDQRIKNTKEQMEAQDALSGAYAKQSATAAAMSQRFGTSVRELGISIGHLLIPSLQKAANIITPLVDGMASFAHEHEILAGAVTTSVAAIGVLAATVGIAGLAVSGLSKGVLLLKTGIAAYNFVIGFAAVKTGTLTGAIMANEAAARGATTALKLYNGALLTTSVLSLAVLTNLKAIAEAQKERDREKQNNPFGLNFHGSAADNKNALKKIGASDEDFSRWQKAYYARDTKSWKEDMDKQGWMGYFNNPVGAATRAIQRRIEENAAPASGIGEDRSEAIGDSTRRSIDSFYTPAAYVPKSAAANVVVTIENNNGSAVTVSKNSAGSATGVPVQVKSTTSRQIGFK